MNSSIFGPVRWMIITESLVFLLLLALAVRRPAWWEKWQTRGLAFLPKSGAAQAGLVCGLVLLLRLCLVPLFPPVPMVWADDTSLLFQAHTFADLRLRNPVPDFVESVDPMYVTDAPYWVSQYQPGNGLTLALGVGLGNPWIGVFLSTGVMLLALWWAARGYFTERWSLAALLIAAIQWGVFGPQMNTFHGGNVAVIGGALIVGGLARQRPSFGFVIGLGVVLVAACRPLEAAIWVMVVLPTLLYRKQFRTCAELCAAGCAGFAALAFYNFQTTGNLLQPPYLVHLKEFGTPQGFWFQRLFPPGHSAGLSDLDTQYKLQARMHDHGASWASFGKKVEDGWQYFVGPLWTLPLLFIPVAARQYRWLTAAAGIFIVEHAAFHAWETYHSSPEVALYLVLLTACLRATMRMRAGRRVIGPQVVSCGLAAGIICLIIPGVGRAIEPALPGKLKKMRAVWYCEYPEDRLRSTVERKVLAQDQRAVVFVRFDAPNIYYPWIANLPDIETQKIIWARDLGNAEDAKLLGRYGGRAPWLLDLVDCPAGQITPPFADNDQSEPFHVRIERTCMVVRHAPGL